jgi:hypothetical protein
MHGLWPLVLLGFGLLFALCPSLFALMPFTLCRFAFGQKQKPAANLVLAAGCSRIVVAPFSKCSQRKNTITGPLPRWQGCE